MGATARTQAPKTNETRVVPIPTKTRKYLRELIATNPSSDDPEAFVFWGKDAKTPVDHKTVAEILNNALGKIGIGDGQRKARKLSFHSWRHLFNSLFRTHIADAKLQRLTGHKTQQMTEHYTHFQLQDFEDFSQLQEHYFSKQSDAPR